MKLAVVGTGLIGGAVARAARARKVAQHIVGFEPNAEFAQAALAAGVVDELVEKIPLDIDVILLACPSDRVGEWVQTLQNHASLLLDVASVKQHILDDVETRLGSVPANFVACHPIAGSEKQGPLAAPLGLLEGRKVVLTPHDNNTLAYLEQAESLWRELGADVVRLDAQAHDQVLALTSHLPHLLAYAFMHPVGEASLDFTGGGFRDFTRIAASNPEMWWRIFRLNRAPLLGALDRFEADLAQLRQALADNDEARGRAMLQQAAERRLRLEGEP